MKLKNLLFGSIFLVIITTLVSSYALGGDAVYRMQVVTSGAAYNTGRMYCETPINILLDNPTTGANAFQISIYFSGGTQINPIPSWYSVFEQSLFPNIGVFPTSPNTGGNLLTYKFKNTTPGGYIGMGGVVATFRVTSLTGISSTQLIFNNTPTYNSVSSVGATELLSGTIPLTINFATGPCLRDTNPPIITRSTIANSAYRVTTGINVKYVINDQNGIGSHYRYVTTTYSNVSAGNYIQDYVTGDNQYGVNSGTIATSISGQIFSGGSAGYSAIAIGQTWDLHDRGYDITISGSNLPAFPIEQTRTIIVTGRDNLNNLVTSTIMFNAPRAPFLYRTGIVPRNGGATISTPYSNRLPNGNTLIYPRLNAIKFMVLDDRAGVNSGSLVVTIRSGSITGPILWSGNYATFGGSLTTSGILYTAASYTGSNPIMHNYNYTLNITSGGIYGFNLPYNTDIYVVVSGTDLAGTPFAQTGFATDQNNYFKFTTRNSCIVSQCIDRVSIDTGNTNTQMTFSGTQLTITGGTQPYLSGDTIYCSVFMTGINLQTGYVTFQTGYLSGVLTIKPTTASGFTTYLSGDTVYVKKYICGDGTIQTPNFSLNNEQCDDSNIIPGDGCSAICQLEPVNCASFNLTVNPTTTYSGGTMVYFSGANKTGYRYQMLSFGYGSSRNVSGSTLNTGYTYTSGGTFTGSVTIQNIYSGSMISTCNFSGVTVNYCGDGTTNGTEQCDDGNSTPGDGCSATCQIEPVDCTSFNLTVSPLIGYNPGFMVFIYSGAFKTGYSYYDINYNDGGSDIINNSGFSISHSYISNGGYIGYVRIQNNFNPGTYTSCNFTGVSIRYCGDGIVSGPEECDDGNLTPGDGCSASCTRETPDCTGFANNISATPTTIYSGEIVTFSGIVNTGFVYASLYLNNSFSYQLNNTPSFTYQYSGYNSSSASPYVVIVNSGDFSHSGSCYFSGITINYCGDGLVQTGNGEQCDNGNSNGISSSCSTSCTRNTPTCSLIGSPNNATGSLEVTFTGTIRNNSSNRASYSGINFGDGSGYSGFTGVYNHIYSGSNTYAATVIVRNNFSTGIFSTCTGSVTISNFFYTVQAWPESRVQGGSGGVPNLRIDGAKVGIYSGHILLYTGIMSIYQGGTGSLALPAILSGTYDITFEGLSHARSMLSGIVLTQNDRFLDFTTGSNLIGVKFGTGGGSVTPYTGYYQYAGDITDGSGGTTKDQIITTHDFSQMQTHLLDLSNNNYGGNPYDLNADGDNNSTDLGIIITNRLANVKTIGSGSRYQYNLPWITF